MKHGVKTKKLGRTQAHRKALLRNLVRSLFVYERIRTTLPKAKVAQRLAERLITYSKLGTLAARRNAQSILTDKPITKKLFDDIGPRFKDRVGGSTRILRLGPRPSDGAEMSYLELVVRKERAPSDQKEKGKEKKEK
jgi:large subunit ribosomal protein L17